ncbi:hypothetical protein [Paraburkholderia lacunae]|nr:hypothetical protein [Paraburkholderia lacunae]
MEKSMISPATARQNARLGRHSEEVRRWVVGCAIAVTALGLFAAAVIYAPSSIGANNTLCLQQIAKEEHLNLEAFFQKPAQQDAFVQAVTICSK